MIDRKLKIAGAKKDMVVLNDLNMPEEDCMIFQFCAGCLHLCGMKFIDKSAKS